MKLNTDGSYQQQQAAGGGVLRDDKGFFIYAFYHHYGAADILYAELCAIRDGLVICNAMELKDVEVETESNLAYQMIVARCSIHWQYTYLVRECRELFQSVGAIHHIYREQNGVADLLAKQPCTIT